MENSIFSKKNEKICIIEENQYNQGRYSSFQTPIMKNSLYILISLGTSLLSEHVFAADTNAGILG